jgi:hypothetical protein
MGSAASSGKSGNTEARSGSVSACRRHGMLTDFAAVAGRGERQRRRNVPARSTMCEFGEMEGAVFSRESIEAALQDFEPLSL